jgi:hypothetical protein
MMKNIIVDSAIYGQIELTYIGSLSIKLDDEQFAPKKWNVYTKLHPNKWRNAILNKTTWSCKTIDMDMHYWTHIVDDNHRLLCNEWINEVNQFFNMPLE